MEIPEKITKERLSSWVFHGLLACIKAHGPITEGYIASAVKRITFLINAAFLEMSEEQFDAELKESLGRWHRHGYYSKFELMKTTSELRKSRKMFIDCLHELRESDKLDPELKDFITDTFMKVRINRKNKS